MNLYQRKNICNPFLAANWRKKRFAVHIVKENVDNWASILQRDPLTFSAVWHGDLGEDGLSTMSM